MTFQIQIVYVDETCVNLYTRNKEAAILWLKENDCEGASVTLTVTAYDEDVYAVLGAK